MMIGFLRIRFLADYLRGHFVMLSLLLKKPQHNCPAGAASPSKSHCGLCKGLNANALEGRAGCGLSLRISTPATACLCSGRAVGGQIHLLKTQRSRGCVRPVSGLWRRVFRGNPGRCCCQR